MPDFHCGIENDLSKPIITGSYGTSIVFSGWFYHETKKVKKIEIVIGNHSFPVMNIRGVRFDALQHQASIGMKNVANAISSGFWTIVNLPGVMTDCEIKAELRATLTNGEVCVVDLGFIRLAPLRREKAKIGVTERDKPNLAICMATYNPRIDLFQKQIESIRNQTYQNWVCIINDDATPYAVYKEMLKIIDKDPRFIVFRNEQNVGFYHNFEKCLQLVPDYIEFIALSDQDDEWYPNKLEECLKTFDEETALVYSDMNLIDDKGNVLSNTYWTNRKNNYTDLEFLLLANTITGAASVFRAELLSKILPFPERVGDSFHDWWIALCAFMHSKIKYIDKPLYGYCQHGSNVLGHSGKKKSFKDSKIFNQRSFKGVLNEIKRILKHSLFVYNIDYKRIVLTANVLYQRYGDQTNKKTKTIKAFTRIRSLPSMLFLYFKGKLFKRDTLNAELRLLLGVLANKTLNPIYAMRKNIYARNVGQQVVPDSTSNKFQQSSILTVESLLQKIAPIQLKPANYTPQRINIIIPTIDFKYFFGGYLGKFNLAKKLSLQGYAVRILIVDYCDFNMEQWRQEIKNYKGLENIFDLVEVEYVFDRTKTVDVNPEDVFIATTWWTAYIAHDAVKQLKKEKFIYLIQEYEPFTFAHGAYYALADATYNFPHYAIFSTELLREYFRESKIGVYKNSTEAGDEKSVSFENAILSFNVDAEELKNRKKKKLLFYARPEPHASRNMFEVGIIALIKAIESGTIDLSEWEFYGMGTVENYKEIKLTDAVSMKLLAKMSLDEYRNKLPEFDVGLSLMYTPHPSLVPLEMAAAGMIVVTNSYANKTGEKLKEISTNILVATPDIDGIKEKIINAMKLSDDIVRRLEGSKVNWSTDWAQTFNNRIVEKIDQFILRSQKYVILKSK